MRIVGITELMPLLRLSSFPFSRYASLYLLLSPDNRSLLSLRSELPSICFSAPGFLLLVPHLLTLVSHSLHHNPSLAFLCSVRTPFPGVVCASPHFMCRLDCSTPRNGISGAVLRYSLSHLKGSSARNTPLLHYL